MYSTVSNLTLPKPDANISDETELELDDANRSSDDLEFNKCLYILSL